MGIEQYRRRHRARTHPSRNQLLHRGKKTRDHSHHPDRNHNPFRRLFRGRLRADQVLDRRNEINEEEQERRPRRRHVVINDAVHLALLRVRGRNHQRLIQRIGQQNGR